ncbi:hypothetical protein WOLCODRAFT_17982 [Wolfiporia cocos MD-104 SS10]|uniref:Fungal-type protein kinase domain-containing protein n=1 Tax=Wolfiporia cocos (strain MD-104) TaxID=742152 RepID=A0A2H3JVD1_WOLCO|nr:hypothetical protein WOLCODRAFT_17982 [Wolfiporia cocos MD-104 SS10]
MGAVLPPTWRGKWFVNIGRLMEVLHSYNHGISTAFATKSQNYKKFLRLVHNLGYIHGDLSSSNVLLYKKHIRLVDWEYTKHIDDKSLHKILMGPANFMATEVDLQEYLFYKLQPEGDTHQPDEEVDEDEEESKSESGRDNDNDNDSEKPMLQPIPFLYLPLHDLESLWWMMACSIFNKTVANVKGTSATRPPAEDQVNYAKALFLIGNQRGLMLQSPNILWNHTWMLHVAIQPRAKTSTWP